MTLLGIVFLVTAALLFAFGWHPSARYGYSAAGLCLCAAVALLEFGAQLLR